MASHRPVGARSGPSPGDGTVVTEPIASWSFPSLRSAIQWTSTVGGIEVVALILVFVLVGGFVALRYRSEDGSDGPLPGSTREREEPSTDPDPPSDRDRVLALLERNGGRMRQVRIVAETGWSKSKTSVVLSEMEADGLVSKLRVGRENIVSIAGREFETAPGSTPED